MKDQNGNVFVIDVGTSNLKAIIFDGRGNQLCREFLAHKTTYAQSSWAEQDPRDWLRHLALLFRTIGNKYPRLVRTIKAIVLTGQMHGPVLVDREGNTIGPCLIWSDTRAQQENSYLKSFGQEYFLQRTGNTPQVGYTLPKLLWLHKNRGETFKSIWKVLFPKDYISLHLTGQANTDPSDASGSLAYNIQQGEWDTDLIHQCGLPEEIFPEIVNSTSIVGVLRAEWSDYLSVQAESIPVIKGGGDLATTALATGTARKDTLSLCVGTAGQLLVGFDRLEEGILGKLYTFSHCIPRKFFCLGTIPAGGSSFHWFTSLSGKTAIDQIIQELPDKTIDVIGNTVLFFPYLAGAGTPTFDYLSRGAFFGLHLGHTRKDLAIAVMEGVSFALRDSYEVFSRFWPGIRRIIMSGGGVRISLWPSIVAEVFNLPVLVSQYPDTAAQGAFLLASDVLGEEGSRDDLSYFIQKGENNPSGGKVSEYYHQKYLLYNNLYQVMKEGTGALREFEKEVVGETDG